MPDEVSSKPPNVRLAVVIGFFVGFFVGGLGVYFAGDQAYEQLRTNYQKLQEANRSLLKELGRGEPPPAAQ